MEKYMILNQKNIAESMVTYCQQLINVPLNYIKVEDETMLWHKYDFETHTWSEEKFEPESSAQLSEFEQIKKNNEILAKTVADLTMENRKKNLLINQLAQSTADLNVELNKLKGGN
ncbi:hypothetical protein [Clostridium rectalis]|uniref:hypothetical protein n=1 Tax=Clostridium rectalis TaxID=2040295 RepID=UPI000F635E67|nr:hypothetical protein [Clostridium rectalis]